MIRAHRCLVSLSFVAVVSATVACQHRIAPIPSRLAGEWQIDQGDRCRFDTKGVLLQREQMKGNGDRHLVRILKDGCFDFRHTMLSLYGDVSALRVVGDRLDYGDLAKPLEPRGSLVVTMSSYTGSSSVLTIEQTSATGDLVGTMEFEAKLTIDGSLSYRAVASSKGSKVIETAILKRASAKSSTNAQERGSEPQLLQTASIKAHRQGVTRILYCSDDSLLSCGISDHYARLWNVVSGKETRRFDHKDDPVWSIAVSQDGRYVATGSHVPFERADAQYKTIRVWQKASGRQVLDGTALSWITALAFTSDSKGVAGAGWPTGKVISLRESVESAHLWEIESGRVLRSYRHPGAVTDMSLTPNGEYMFTICSSSRQTPIFVWQMDTGELVRRFGPTGDDALKSLNCITSSPDGGSLLTGGTDGAVRRWDVASGRQTQYFKKKDNDVIWSVAWSPDGRRLLSGHASGDVVLWDVQSGKELRQFETRPQASIKTVAFSPNGRVAASGGMDGVIRFWDLPAPAETRPETAPNPVENP